VNVVFRVDASTEIGTGHVQRCLTLAEILIGFGMQCKFVCRAYEGNLLDYIKSKGHAIYALPELSAKYTSTTSDIKHADWLGAPFDIDASNTLNLIKDTESFNFFIIDHYGIDRRWEGIVRNRCNGIMVIDDLADREHDCDLLLDQNLYENPKDRYANKVNNKTILLLGPEYSLLRNQFTILHKSITSRDGSINRILVMLGGSDPTNVTSKVLKALLRTTLVDKQISIILGLSNPYFDAVNALAREFSAAEVLIGVDEIASIMAKSDFAIGASGVSTWERCSMGVPSVVISVADNQIEIGKSAHARGLLYYLGRSEDITEQFLAQTIEKLIKEKNTLKNISQSGINYVDGNGTYRVVQKLLSILK